MRFYQSINLVLSIDLEICLPSNIWVNLSIMRRPTEAELTRNLRESEFNFLGYNPIQITEIYELVQVQYPHLCDDNYLCIDHCRNGNKQPEWKHAVRSTLESFKVKGKALNGPADGLSREVWQLVRHE